MVPIADAHSDFIAYHILNDADNRLFNHADIEKMLKGGVALQVFAVWVPAEHPQRMDCGLSQIKYLFNFLNDSGDHIQLCTNADDIVSGTPIKAILAIESGESLDCRVDTIRQAYDMGARIMSLTWNGENRFASGCCADGGVKPAGKEAIQALNRLRMALDLSHINEQGFWEAVQLYDNAPCATHSCVYDMVPCPRNLKNNQIDYLISHHGFIGVNFYTEFLKGRYADIDDIIDHIEYILSRGGENTVGLGSDFCGIQYTPNGLDSVADFQKIPEALAKRGYDEKLVLKICYGNFVEYILKFLKQHKVGQYEKRL